MANLTKALDVSKFRKTITKNIEGINVGFDTDPELWISTGNYTLNYLISGDFNKGIPMSRVTMLAGESGSGKSFISSGNIVRNAQKQGIYTIIIDTENAIDEQWLQALDVDTSEEKLLKVGITMVDDVSKFISDFMDEYEKDHGNLPLKEQPPVLFVIDSLGMLMTITEINQAETGDLKGDMGRKAKTLKHLVNFCNRKMARFNIGVVATNHTYSSQNMFSPDPVVSGGNGFMYASSIILAMRKSKLKEDEDGNKTTEVSGIRAVCVVTKTRFNHSAIFKQVSINIPFDKGMDEYSGLFDFFESNKILIKEGNRYAYSGKSGEFKEFRKNITDEQLDMLMKDHPHVFGNATE